MSRLFSHVASKVGHNTEDLATEALFYILQSDEVLLEAFVAHVNDVSGATLEADMRLATQKTTTDGGRPDLIGWVRGSERRLFVESKFGASLSGNQPTGYLDELESESGSVLLLLVPDRRKLPIWREVASKCAEDGYTPEVDASTYHIHFDSGQHLSITTWSKVLNILEQAALNHSAIEAAEDLRQLRALCEQQGSGVFRPFKENEFDPWIAERIIDLHDIVDDLKGSLESQSTAWNVTSKKVTLSNMNYRFFATLFGCEAEIGVRYRWWAKRGLSPLWMRLFTGNRKTQYRGKELLEWPRPVFEGDDFGPTHLLIPFETPTGLGRQDVVRHLVDQLQFIATRLEPVLASNN
ncbi:hypothetical protein CRI93_14640 [Longimonas halophila]|jgi:hypothetical protein|uniref:PD-(D/E)XK nuclease superfamily protein n=1 Tax=Longimonas halophila TaxID=1469170 RepID=A0A2H3P3K0_9BACT|nr:hypothetical protein [Longimonas halophila]PEN04744.1 hypothetical protein CRI93_14640 [Longimonas halophila]